jgi:hypothetical protein
LDFSGNGDLPGLTRTGHYQLDGMFTDWQSTFRHDGWVNVRGVDSRDQGWEVDRPSSMIFIAITRISLRLILTNLLLPAVSHTAPARAPLSGAGAGAIGPGS